MKNLARTILIAFVCAFSVIAFGGVEPVNIRVQGADLYDLKGSTSSLDIADNKYWMMADGFWETDFTVTDVENTITLGLDESDMTFMGSAFAWRVKLNVEYKRLAGDEIHSSSIEDVVLDINYDPARGTTYRDRSVFHFSNGLEVNIEVVTIEKLIGETWTEVVESSLPDALFLESEITTTRYYPFDQTEVPSAFTSITTTGDELKVVWPFVEGAEEYELEWTWVNGYKGSLSGGEPETWSASEVDYNFDLNATRVRISGQNSYSIPLIYGEGFVLVRYRGIGRGGETFTIPLEGKWNSAAPGLSGSQGTVIDYGSVGVNYIVVTGHENNAINYGAGMSFIENGVRSVGVTYMDGVLKPRQSQAKLNGQDKIIVGSTIYDHYGRPAIGVMSAPVDQSVLGYIDNLNMHTDGTPYGKEHFDRDVTDPSIACGDYQAAPPMSSTLSSGAANYYSNDNPDKEGANAYLPDAEGYPFVQVQYADDPTGRVRRVGGLGPDHQVGDVTVDGETRQAHYTEYFYTTIDNEEVYELFGNDAAAPSNYTKVITKDVHGQLSMAIVDPMGRTIATYMAGRAPLGLEEIKGNDGPDNLVTKDLTDYNIPDDIDGVIETNHTHFVEDETVVYEFNYDFTAANFSECLLPEVDLCFDCIYDIEVIIRSDDPNCEIQDNLENVISTDGEVGLSYTVGSIAAFDPASCDDTPLTFSGVNGAEAATFKVKFPKIGNYQIIKKLVVSQSPIDYYWELYKENSTCLLSESFFVKEALTYIDPSDCDDIGPCEMTFLLEFGTLEMWLAANPGSTEIDYNNELEAHMKECETMNSCDYMYPLMESDFREGGQYSIKDLMLEHLAGSAESTALLTALFEEHGGFTSWRDFGLFYEADGETISTITNGAGDEIAPPYTGITLSEFANDWRDSWADNFTLLHPEFCYFEFCEDHLEIFEYEQLLNSVDTYAEACSIGLLNPLPVIAPDTDKIFELPGCAADIDDVLVGIPSGLVAEIKAILAEEYEYMPASFLSIYQYAVHISGDPVETTFGTGCNADKHWRAFRSLYFSKRFRIIELLKDDYVTATACSDYVNCIGVTDGTACDVVVGGSAYYPFSDKFPRYFDFGNAFVDYDEFDWDAYDGADEAEGAIEAACLSQCEGLADKWMTQLAGCVDGPLVVGTWNEGQTTYDLVRLKLIEVCAGGCDNEWPFPIQVDYGTATNTFDLDPVNWTFHSFADVIENLVGFETAECSNLLITNPQASDGDESLITNLDACACDLLLPTSTVEEFEAAHGFVPVDYQAELCLCEGFDDGDNVIDTAEEEDLVAAEIFTPNNYPDCGGSLCISCADLLNPDNPAYGYLPEFTSEFAEPGEDDVTYLTHPMLFTAWVNEKTNGNYTYDRLLELIDNCKALNDADGTKVYHLFDPKMNKIRDLLNKLNDGGLSDAQSGLNRYTLPEYLNSSLYPCGDADVATYNYIPTVTTNLTFGITTEDCTDDDGCVFTLSVPGTIPPEFSDFSDVLENVESFGEVYMKTPLIGESLGNFYLNTTVNYPDGTGTVEMEFLFTNTCYDFVTDHYFHDRDRVSFQICSGDVIPKEDDCLDLMIRDAEIAGEGNYKEYLDEKYAEFKRNYIEKCTRVDETFNMEYFSNRYHYTLLYYDQSGNLVKTVPPKGVNHLTPEEIEDVIEHATDPVAYPTAVYPDHDYETTYKHNSLNQVVEVNTPDGGNSTYFYDHIGRLVVSQNAKQAAFKRGIITDDYDEGAAVQAYSYTLYDELGRVTEVGEISHPTPMTKEIAKNPVLLADWFAATTILPDDTPVIRNNITQMHYDKAYSTAAVAEFGAAGYGHTRNRIVATSVITGYVYPSGTGWIYPDPDYVNHYKYDIHGNVKTYLQEIDQLAEHDNRFRTVDYEYDLISGNPNFIYYQKDKPDQYIHKYVYDKDNRLKEVFTSAKGLIWDRDVNYEYREDGYLARTEIGEMKVQGMDYAYTLHGWLKTLNSGVLNADYDMGRDGRRDGDSEYASHENEVHGLVAKDALAYTVGYYENDYAAISQGETDFDNMQIEMAGAFTSDPLRTDLYNGNITSLITNLTDFNGNKLDVHANVYHYDQLHRFKDVHVYTHSNITATNSLASATRNNPETFTTDQFSGSLGDYEVHVDYDQNGNITELIRMAHNITGEDAGSSTATDNGMDKFKYIYNEPGTNKLTRVEDYNDNEVVSIDGDPVNFGDIKSGQTGANYTYHADGSLKSDADEEIAYIDWYPSGKIKRIYRTETSEQPDLYFEYDPMGMRTLKVEMTRTGTVINPDGGWKYTYYACDANGTALAVYQLDENDRDHTLKKTESMLYGGSRLGMDVDPVTVSGYQTPLPCKEDGKASFIFQVVGPSDNVSWWDEDVTITFDGNVIADISDWISPDISVFEIVSDINSSGLDLEAELLSGAIDDDNYVALIEVTETSPGAYAEGVSIVYDTDARVTITETRAFSAGDCYADRELGLKYYEVSNHLGNVMEVISDRKIAEEDEDELIYAEDFEDGLTGDFTAGEETTLANESGVLEISSPNKTLNAELILPTEEYELYRLELDLTGKSSNIFNLFLKLEREGEIVSEPLGLEMTTGTNSFTFEGTGADKIIGFSIDGSSEIATRWITLDNIKLIKVGEGFIDHFLADVVQYSDYYPYGMTMPGRNGSIGSKYRYAFNGMEQDGEVSGSGNSYTTQFRQYDPRLGRWKSMDPLAGKYPEASPFSAFNNNPIFYVDPLGLEGVNPGGSEDNPVEVSNGAEEIDAVKDHADRGNTDDLYIKNGNQIIKYTYDKTSGTWTSAFKSEGASDWSDGVIEVEAPVKEGGKIISVDDGPTSDVSSQSTQVNTNSSQVEEKKIEVINDIDASGGVYVTGVGTWLSGDANVRSQYKKAWSEVTKLYQKGLISDATASMIRYQLQKVSKMKLSPIGSMISEKPPFGKPLDLQRQKAESFLKDPSKKLSSGAFNTRQKTNIAAKISKSAGPLLIFVGAYMSVENIVTSDTPVETTLVEVGSWSGAYAGAMVGATFGPIGAIVGGIIGGWVGAEAMNAWIESMNNISDDGSAWAAGASIAGY